MSDERRDVARALRGDPTSTAIEQRRDGFELMTYHEAAYRFWDMCRRVRSATKADIANSTCSVLADLIDPTCTYEPDETRAYWDEEDREHETNEPSDGCGSFSCSECGFEMMHDCDIGWFDTEPPYRPHFRFCPNCGSRLVPPAPYDRVADAKEDGDER
ncbi:MAG: hypothetical protein MR611_04795 [Coriobacteriaceae bacterium]|nr:hypothetical protein [Coriobacteriaceae bacterium]